MAVSRNIAGNTRRRATGRPFTPGNPGKPKGARNKATIAIESLLENERDAIGKTLVEKAKDGDAVALKLAVERLAPLRRGRPVTFELPEPLGHLEKQLAMEADR